MPRHRGMRLFASKYDVQLNNMQGITAQLATTSDSAIPITLLARPRRSSVRNNTRKIVAEAIPSDFRYTAA